jgi:phage terminase large subunit
MIDTKPSIDVESQIVLNRFVPRWYQLPIFDAIENKKYLKVVAILPRRAGKDIACWNLMIRRALKRVGVYWYIWPTYAQGKKGLWDGISNDGTKFLDYIPRALIDSLNSQEMKIKLINGSLIQIIGSDNVDSLVGSNPIGCVFSEYALQDPRAYQYIRPILTANGGWAVFISTVRGRNHLWEMFQIAKHSKDWFCYRLTIDDTKHIPFEEIERERQDGIMSEDLIQQEYYNSFELGVEGAYYTKYIDRMRLNNQIGQVPWEHSFKVNTAWDIGTRDSTVIIFYQTIGATVRIIDYYENQKEGLEHYIKVIESKPYIYGKHIAPHDIAVMEWGTGMTRIEKAKHLGLRFTVATNVDVMDGIESVRSALSKVYIDSTKCSTLIRALENYRQEYDAKRMVYKQNPLHDKWSHAADAMRYLCVSLSKVKDGLSAEDLDRRYAEAIYGDQGKLPRIFRDDIPNNYR